MSPTHQTSNSPLRWFEFRVLRQQLLDADEVEADGDLHVVVVLLDRDDRSDTELCMPDAHARPQFLGGLIFVFVPVTFLRLFEARRPALSSVRIRPELVMAVRE